ncbi:MAG: hypothetical protein Q4G03_02365 [Planctomycetia bacterium]|nr:hypothetical protein [Planctomycetia bacterium]
MAELDVYRDWLKITVPTRPLNYYQLLKFNDFVDDPKLIRERYQQLNEHVRKYATGDYIEESQALLNELVRAMLCLTDAERKAEYDHQLGRKVEGQSQTDAYGRRSFEAILREESIVSPDQIKKAKAFSDAVGVDLHQALLQQKAADPERIMVAYAESLGLPFVNLDDVPVDEFYAPQINPVTARQHSFVPVMSDMGKLILASPEPISIDVEDELRMLFEIPVRCAICTPQQINAAIAKYYPRDAVQRIVKRDSSESENTSAKAEKTKPVAKKQAAEKTYYTPAARKNRIKLAIVGFNFSFMICMFALYFILRRPSAVVMLPAGIVVGAIVAGIMWKCAPATVAEDEE